MLISICRQSGLIETNWETIPNVRWIAPLGVRGWGGIRKFTIDTSLEIAKKVDTNSHKKTGLKPVCSLHLIAFPNLQIPQQQSQCEPPPHDCHVQL